MKTIFFVIGVLFPYGIEQYAYWKLSPGKSLLPQKVIQGYGWRLIWDVSYFFVLLGTGYRIIMLEFHLLTWEWLGYIMFLAGIVLRIWALFEIGGFYDPGIAIKDDHQIVRSGPYRILRHPLHIGTLLQISGLAVLSVIWIRLPAILASLTLCMYLNRIEDITHSREINDEFRSYYFQTWDLVDLIFWKSKLR